MRVNLAETDWQSGFAVMTTDGGNTLMLNLVDEDFAAGETSVAMGVLLVELVYRDGTRKRCVNVIGMSDGVVTVGTDNDGLLGHVLSPSNIAECWLGVDDREAT